MKGRGGACLCLDLRLLHRPRFCWVTHTLCCCASLLSLVILFRLRHRCCTGWLDSLSRVRKLLLTLHLLLLVLLLLSWKCWPCRDPWVQRCRRLRGVPC